MSNPARKLARQQKRSTPEGKEQIKQEKAEKKAAQPPQPFLAQNQNATGHQPPTRIRQRRSGNA